MSITYVRSWLQGPRLGVRRVWWPHYHRYDKVTASCMRARVVLLLNLPGVRTQGTRRAVVSYQAVSVSKGDLHRSIFCSEVSPGIESIIRRCFLDKYNSYRLQEHVKGCINPLPDAVLCLNRFVLRASSAARVAGGSRIPVIGRASRKPDNPKSSSRESEFYETPANSSRDNTSLEPVELRRRSDRQSG